jgi:sporulation protein YlmC with PRC-barrel domain
VLGWSVKKQMLGQDVHNDQNENIGDVENVIVSPKKRISWALIGVGGFLGVGKKLAAIPMDQLQM